MRYKPSPAEERIAGVPRIYWGVFLDEIIPVNDEQKKYVELLNEVLRGKWWSLTVLGTVGNGKTMLACGALEIWNGNHPYEGFYITQEQLTDECRATFSDNSDKRERDVLHKYMDASFLVLDEITTRNWTEYTKYLVQRILSYRHSMRLRTVLIGNLDVKTFKEMFDEHIISRLREGETKTMSAEDMRTHGDF